MYIDQSAGVERDQNKLSQIVGSVSSIKKQSDVIIYVIITIYTGPRNIQYPMYVRTTMLLFTFTILSYAALYRQYQQQ